MPIKFKFSHMHPEITPPVRFGMVECARNLRSIGRFEAGFRALHGPARSFDAVSGQFLESFAQEVSLRRGGCKCGVPILGVESTISGHPN